MSENTAMADKRLTARGSASCGPAPCPPWCDTAPHEPGDEVHMSVPAGMAAVTDDHICGYKRGPFPESCPQETCAMLVRGVDSAATCLEIYHGDDILPALSLEAAGQLAGHMLDLIREAAGPATPSSSGCPWAWCSKAGDDDHNEIHMSDGLGVPVAYTAGSMPRSDTCGVDVSAWLIRGDEDEFTSLVLHHGDECVPEMPLAAAESLARAILALIRVAASEGPANENTEHSAEILRRQSGELAMRQMKADALDRGLSWALWERGRADDREAREPAIPARLRRLAQFTTGQEFGHRFMDSAATGLPGIEELCAAWSREVGLYPESTMLRRERERKELAASYLLPAQSAPELAG
jgi:hypothetical protein